MNDCGTQPVTNALNMSNRSLLSNGRLSLHPLVGMGSRLQVVGFDDKMNLREIYRGESIQKLVYSCSV